MKARFIYLVLASSATVITLLLTTLPGDTSLVLRSSQAIGGTDLTDALGHIALFAVLTTVWHRATCALMDSRAALIGTTLAVFALGILTEAAQHFIPERGANVFDLAANIFGIGLAVIFLIQRDRKKHCSA